MATVSQPAVAAAFLGNQVGFPDFPLVPVFDLLNDETMLGKFHFQVLTDQTVGNATGGIKSDQTFCISQSLHLKAFMAGFRGTWFA